MPERYRTLEVYSSDWRHAWPVGMRVDYRADTCGTGRSRWAVGTIVGHTPKSVRVLPDGESAHLNRAPPRLRRVDRANYSEVSA